MPMHLLKRGASKKKVEWGRPTAHPKREGSKAHHTVDLNPGGLRGMPGPLQ